MKASIKFITMLFLVLLLSACSKEEREANRLYKSLMEDITEIDALENDASISDKLAVYSQARYKLERIRTRYAATKKGKEILENPTFSSGQSAEDILSEALSLEDRASEELSENQVKLIIISAISTPEIRNHRLESHGISLARQGNTEEAKAILPDLLNSLSKAIVQLEIAKAYYQEDDIEAAKSISLEAHDKISQYNLNENICSTVSCDNEEARKRLVDTELRRFRIELYSS